MPKSICAECNCEFVIEKNNSVGTLIGDKIYCSNILREVTHMELKEGERYTVFSVSELLATTTRKEIVIINNVAGNTIYRLNPEGLKKKEREQGYILKMDGRWVQHTAIIPGWNLPFYTDFEDKGIRKIEAALRDVRSKLKSKASKRRYLRLIVKAEMYKGFLEGSRD